MIRKIRIQIRTGNEQGRVFCTLTRDLSFVSFETEEEPCEEDEYFEVADRIEELLDEIQAEQLNIM